MIAVVNRSLAISDRVAVDIVVSTSPLSSEIILLETTKAAYFPCMRANNRSRHVGPSMRKRTRLSAPNHLPTRTTLSSPTRPIVENAFIRELFQVRRSTILISAAAS